MTFGSFGSCQLPLTACGQMIVERMIKYLNNILKLKFENRVLRLDDDDERLVDDTKVDDVDERFDWANEDGWEISLELDELDEHESVRLIGGDDLWVFKHADSNK